jgi:hypothetical protein
LSDKVADYSLKLGNAARTLSKAEKKEDGSVVLTTQASTLTAGTYTLTFGEKTAEIVCEASKVTSIVVEPEAAIMTASNSAVAYFKVLNQFGEDVTKRTNLSVTGTDVSEATSKFAEGEVRFVSTSGQYNLNLTQLSLSIADRDSGVFFSKVLTVSEQSRLNEAEIKGVYKVSGNLVKEAALEEGATQANLAEYYLLVSGTDQYGLPFDPEKMDSSSISLTLSSLTGLTVTVSPAAVNGDSNIKKVELDGKEYAAYPLGNNNSGGAGLKSGEVSVIGYVLTSGKQLKETIMVGGNVKVASLKVYSNAPIYDGSIADLEYEALDSDGNSITDINVLRKFNTSESFDTNGVFFVGSANGVAKLKMDLKGFNTVSQTIKNVSWLSDTNVFGYTNLTILPNPVPVAVVGVWTKPETFGFSNSWLATSTATDGAVTITARDLKYEDQYGNIISWFDFDDVVSGASINIQVTNTLTTNEGIGQIGSGVTGSTPVGNGSAVVVSYAAVKGSDKVGIQKVTVASTANVNNVTRTSNRSFDVAAVPMKACSMTVSYGTSGNNFYAATTNNDVTGSALSVNVSYGDTRVRVAAEDDYTYSGNLEVLDPTKVGANATGNGKVLVILSGAGIVREAAYTTGNATPKVASSKYTSKYSDGYASVTQNAAAELSQYVEGVTQYRNGTVPTPTISVSNPEGTGYSVNNNGKTNCAVTFTAKGSYSINVTYYWEGGYTFTDTLYFRVK